MKTPERTFPVELSLIFALLFVGPIASHVSAQDDPAPPENAPNILWIGVDDLRVDLGIYGSDYVKSPNIDRLAERGVRFTRAYVQQAVCAASRASLLTGMRPDTTGVNYPYTKEFETEFIRQYPTLPTYFDQHGYWTRAIGKIHHAGGLDLDELDEPTSYPYTGPRDNWQNYVLPENIAKRKAKDQNPPAYEAADVPDTGYKDGAVAASLIESLRKAAEDPQRQPFFYAAGFVKPHLPFNCPKKYWDMYDPATLPEIPVPQLPEGAPRDLAIRSFELPSYEGGYAKDSAPVPDDVARKLRHGYFACISYIDAQIGKILDALDETGLAENTVIVFWSDHGFHLGDQGMWGKHVNYEWATRVPLIVVTPEMRRGGVAGESSDAFVEYVDMFPTICDLAGLSKPDYLEGTSFVPVLENPQRDWKTAAFSQYDRKEKEGYAIRTADWRYIEWQIRKTGEVVARELYDHRADPQESVNVAEKHPEVVEDLSRQLEAGWKAALPEEE